MGLTMAQRKAVTKAHLERYRKGTKTEKGQILDALCATNDWHRDHARKALWAAVNETPRAPRAPRTPVYRYGPEVIEALRTCWAVMDGITGKRLAPALPDVLANLRNHGHLDITEETANALLAMSPATIDRRLKPDRDAVTAPRGRSLTRPGSMLKSAIPIRTWSTWEEGVPGFCEIDLVGHDGGDARGEFCHTLTLTDIATGWTDTRTVRNKAAKWVFAALVEIQAGLPFPLLGIDSDNGSEFINAHLLDYCDTHHITFTRGRAGRSNDGAHVEQKNWTIARRIAGYWRYDTPEQHRLLNQLWALQSPLTNLYTPSARLIHTHREGATVIKKHDTPATPLDRLLDFDQLLDPTDIRAIQRAHDTLDILDQRRRITDLQARLIDTTRGRHTLQRDQLGHTYRTRQKLTHPTRASGHESTNPTTRAT